MNKPLKDIKERFLNIDTFIVGPYLVVLGFFGLFNIQHFITILSGGILAAGVYYIFNNRLAKLRREKRAVEDDA